MIVNLKKLILKINRDESFYGPTFGQIYTKRSKSKLEIATEKLKDAH